MGGIKAYYLRRWFDYQKEGNSERADGIYDLLLGLPSVKYRKFFEKGKIKFLI